MKPSSRVQPSPRMLQALERRSGGGPMGFDAFMEVVLYEPEIGYYRDPRARIGFGREWDFYTASSVPLFGDLVAAACASLAGEEASETEFIEVGAEPDAGVLANRSHPFASARAVRLGDPLDIQGRAIVFSNELFDAQPFRRFRRRDGAWREVGVRLDGPGLDWCELEAPPPALLPADAPEGYVIDAPLRAAALARTIAAQPWHGHFVAFDYGKSWEELCRAVPQGTARSYRTHTQTADLLDAAGTQDLTCHICWDWIADALRSEGFGPCELEFQETFLVRRAGAVLASIAARDAGRPSRDKFALFELLHPGNMGRKFQVLWAARGGPAGTQRIPLPGQSGAR